MVDNQKEQEVDRRLMLLRHCEADWLAAGACPT
jgi:hypothetical protein